MTWEAARYFPGVLGKSNDSVRPQTEAPSTSNIEGKQDSFANEEQSITRTTPAISSPAADFTNISDETLMEAICAGDKDALAQLFRRYARVVRAVAYRILRDTAEADDLLQDVFLFIHRKCTKFDDSKGSARSWIVQVTYHRAIDRRRYLSSRHFYTQTDIDSFADVTDRRAAVPPYDQSIEGVLGTTGLEKIKKSLSEDQWTTMQLYFFEGFTIDEIAAHLGQTAGNIRNHYYRGLEKIRKQMLSKKLQAD